jgi:hypothetical protein
MNYPKVISRNRSVEEMFEYLREYCGEDSKANDYIDALENHIAVDCFNHVGWKKITADTLPKVSIGRDWNGFISNGKAVIPVRLFVRSYNAVTNYTELSWYSLEPSTWAIPFDWPTHFHEALLPPTLESENINERT